MSDSKTDSRSTSKPKANVLVCNYTGWWNTKPRLIEQC
jgi:hypothetical protein